MESLRTYQEAEPQLRSQVSHHGPASAPFPLNRTLGIRSPDTTFAHVEQSPEQEDVEWDSELFFKSFGEGVGASRERWRSQQSCNDTFQ